MKRNKSFTLVEILIAISIIGLLASTIIVSVKGAIDKARSARARAEIKALGIALEMFLLDNNYKYPCDRNRNYPPGLEKYLTSYPDWPPAPWAGSSYDWDYWAYPQSSGGCRNPNESPPNCTPYCYPNDTDPCPSYCAGSLTADGNPEHNKPVYQLSIRFCDINGNNCYYPDWAIGWDMYSSAYWCVSGPCRAHGSYLYNHSGCCIGGSCPIDQPTCPGMIF